MLLVSRCRTIQLQQKNSHARTNVTVHFFESLPLPIKRLLEQLYRWLEIAGRNRPCSALSGKHEPPRR